MVELPAISEKDIAENLRVRLKNETIYVSNTNDYCSFPCHTTVQKAISVSVNEKKKTFAFKHCLCCCCCGVPVSWEVARKEMKEFLSCFPLLLYSS